MPVSIHAPRFREAMPGKYDQRVTFQQFQSTPPVSGRRCPFLGRRQQAAACFNPRPPFPGGDARLRQAPTKSRSFQSTPPVSGRRCFCFSTFMNSKFCFNPRPPFPGGDAGISRYGKLIKRVSIHAPRFREAMPIVVKTIATRPTSFNPRPPFPGGDARRSIASGSASTRFNPRPPFPGGDATFALFDCHGKIVSIHAPRFREAMPRNDSACFWYFSFQSTPPVSGRRCGRGLRPGRGCRTVSIHAPRFREAMLSTVDEQDAKKTVSIHAPRFREAMPP